MPLIHSKSEPAFRQNVKTLMHEEKAGTSKHVQSPQQALAIAYELKRRGRAMGGPNAGVQQQPWYVRQEARGLSHPGGPIMSAVPGRTDRHPLNVPAGSYVLPADHVSSLGQGNTQAGMKILNNMFSQGPYGMAMPSIKRGAGAPRPPKAMSDRGGARGENASGEVPIMAAGGEYIIPPQVVARIGDGDIKRGHAILDKWVVENRKKHVQTLKKLPGPAKA